MPDSQNTSNTQPREFDAYNRTYDEAVNNALAFTGMKVDLFTRVKAYYLLDIIKRLRPEMSTVDVLDVGCGIGNMHPHIVGRIGQLTGVDVSTRCIETARERNSRVKYATFDGINLPFPDRSFDLAFAVAVFHHVPIGDRLPLAFEIRRTLRPGGVFAIFEHNPKNPLTMRVVNNCEFDKDAVLLDRRDSEALLVSSGFQDVATRFILTIPAAGSVLRTIDRLFATFPIGAQYYTLGRI